MRYVVLILPCTDRLAREGGKDNPKYIEVTDTVRWRKYLALSFSSHGVHKGQIESLHIGPTPRKVILKNLILSSSLLILHREECNVTSPDLFFANN